jgi:hypothetical protein
MERVVDDVLDRVVVLLLGLDHPRPEALAEDVVLAAVACVEGFRVLPVEVAHPVREVGGRRLDEQVVVVAHEAPDVEAPAVPPLHPPQDVDEGGAVIGVAEDRRVVVALRSDVVVRARREVAVWPSHPSDGSPGGRRDRASDGSWRRRATVPSRARHGTRLGESRPLSRTNMARKDRASISR